jgi:hypothetical protein
MASFALRLFFKKSMPLRKACLLLSDWLSGTVLKKALIESWLNKASFDMTKNILDGFCSSQLNNVTPASRNSRSRITVGLMEER